MKILNFGSLNIDLVYTVEDIVRPGETIESVRLERFCGGKGLNQSVALARAGAEVWHAGIVGKDGSFLLQTMKDSGVNTKYTNISSEESGHAIIQVDKSGQNSIILYPGANHRISERLIEDALSNFGENDWLLLQNEINNIELIINKAYEKGMKIALNPSPMNESALKLPLEKISLFFLNEIEGAAIAGKESGEEICDELVSKYENASIILTLGSKGAIFAKKSIRRYQDIISTPVVDSTAAGDTFTGYFLQSYSTGCSVEDSLLHATAAASIAVSRKGAVPSIPYRNEVNKKISNM